MSTYIINIVVDGVSYIVDVVKGHIGDGLSAQLVALAACEDLEVAISSAKLLRSITVNSTVHFVYHSHLRKEQNHFSTSVLGHSQYTQESHLCIAYSPNCHHLESLFY